MCTSPTAYYCTYERYTTPHYTTIHHIHKQQVILTLLPRHAPAHPSYSAGLIREPQSLRYSIRQKRTSHLAHVPGDFAKLMLPYSSEVDPQSFTRRDQSNRTFSTCAYKSRIKYSTERAPISSWDRVDLMRGTDGFCATLAERLRGWNQVSRYIIGTVQNMSLVQRLNDNLEST